MQLRNYYFCAVLSLWVVACMAPETKHIDRLRQRVSDNPKDVTGLVRLAEFELLARGGNPHRARAHLNRALELAPEQLQATFLSAFEFDHHGQPERALSRYLRVLHLVVKKSDPAQAHYAEVSALSIGDKLDLVPNFASKVEPAYQKLRLSPVLNAATRVNIFEMLIALAERKGQKQLAESYAEELYCHTSWRVRGPTGVHGLNEFDNLPATQRKLQDGTASQHARRCLLILEPAAQRQQGGLFLGETVITVTHSGHYQLFIRNRDPIQISVDGRSVAEVDRRKKRTAEAFSVPLRLNAGKHTLSIRLASENTAPSLRYALLKGKSVGQLPPQGLTSRLLFVWSSLGSGDIDHAYRLLEPVLIFRRSAWHLAHTLALLRDPTLPNSVKRQRVASELRKAAKDDGRAWLVSLENARLLHARGQLDEALKLLKTTSRSFPEVHLLAMTGLELATEGDLTKQAQSWLTLLKKKLPDSCIVREQVFRQAHQQAKYAEIPDALAKLTECNRVSLAKLLWMIEQRKWQKAEAELQRIQDLLPASQHDSLDMTKLRVALGRGGDKEVAELIGAQRDPGKMTFPDALRVLDHELANGHLDQAQSFIEKVLATQPTALAGLQVARRVVDTEDSLADVRLDGLGVIRDFEKVEEQYEEPQVLVLDYTAVRVFEDGSSLEVTHNITRLQSKQAVEAEGEVHLPGGGRWLTLRTVKPDGTTFEPENIDEKSSISMPKLAEGDYVEIEYMRHRPSAQAFSHGFSWDRFYFQNYEQPFHHSQLTVVAPQSMKLQIETRGTPPKMAVKQEAGLVFRSWIAKQQPRQIPEPLAPSFRETLPSVAFGLHASWDNLIQGARALLADKDVETWPALRLAQQIVRGKKSKLQKLEAIYNWVLDHVDAADDFAGIAAAMLAARRGHRARLLRYLANLLGIESELVLARTWLSDQTETSFAESNLFQVPIVRVRLDKRWLWLAPTERFVPFGYLPPLIQGQDALVINAKSERAVVPSLGLEPELREISVKLKPTSTQWLDAQVEERLRGFAAFTWRTQLENVPEDRLQQVFAQSYVPGLLPGAELESLQIEGQDTRDGVLVLRYVLRVPLEKAAGNRRQLTRLFPTNLEGNFASLPKRTQPLIVAQPLFIRATFQSEAALQASAASQFAGPGNAHFRWMKSAKDVWVRQLQVPVGRIDPFSYKEFADFCRRVDAVEASALRL